MAPRNNVISRDGDNITTTYGDIKHQRRASNRKWRHHQRRNGKRREKISGSYQHPYRCWRVAIKGVSWRSRSSNGKMARQAALACLWRHGISGGMAYGGA